MKTRPIVFAGTPQSEAKRPERPRHRVKSVPSVIQERWSTEPSPVELAAHKTLESTLPKIGRGDSVIQPARDRVFTKWGEEAKQHKLLTYVHYSPYTTSLSYELSLQEQRAIATQTPPQHHNHSPFDTQICSHPSACLNKYPLLPPCHCAHGHPYAT